MSLNIVRDDSKEFKDFNSNKLHEFNRNNCEYIKNHSDHQSNHKITFGFKCMDGTEYAGGVCGVIRFGWCFVDELCIDDKYQKAGIGSKLMKHVEDFATKNNALGVRLYTWSFQAKDFYEKLGYTLYGKFEDCPPGSTEYYFMKKLKK